MPNASSLNYVAGSVVANEVVAKVSADGTVCVRTHADTHLIADITGYVTVPDDPDPDPDPYPTEELEPGWHIMPDSVFLTAPGQSDTARMVHIGADGQPSGRLVPSGTTVTPVGANPFDVERAGADIEITEGGIGATPFAVAIPGVDEPLLLWATSARLRSGVELIPADDFVTPNDLPGTDGFAPFTTAEIGARTSFDGSGDVISWAVAGGYAPVVLEGAAPVTGTVFVASDGSTMFGRVIERPGAPTLERGGRSLITVELAELTDVYTELDGAVDAAEMFEAGLLGEIGGGELVCTGPDCPPAAPSASALRVIEALPEADGNDEPRCVAGLGAGITSLTPPTITNGIAPVGGMRATVSGNELYRFEMQYGIGGSLTLGMGVKAQGSISFDFTCTVTTLPSARFPVIPALAAVFVATMEPTVKLGLNASVSGGPSLEASVTCGVSFEYSYGFTYVPGDGFDPRETVEHPEPTCTPKLAAQWETGPSTIQVSITPSLNGEIGIDVGGSVLTWLGRQFDVDDLGRLKLIGLSAATELRAKWENEDQVRVAKAGASEVGVHLNVGASILFTSVNNALEALGIPVTVSFPALVYTQPIAQLYSTYNKTGSPTISLNGEIQSGGALVVQVEPDDELEVGGFLAQAPAIGAFLLPGPLLPTEIVDGALFIKDSDGEWIKRGGMSFTTSPSGFDPDVEELTGTLTITEDLCEELGDSARDAMVLAEQKMGPLGIFGYLEEFALRCGSSLEFEADQLQIPTPEGATSSSVDLVPGALADTLWKIDDTDPIPDWLTVNPTTGTFDDQDTPTPITVSVDCATILDSGSSSQLYTLTATTDDDAIEEPLVDTLPISVTCDFFRIVEDEVIGGSPVNFATDGYLDDEWTSSELDPSSGFLRGQSSTSDEDSVLSATTPPDNRVPDPIPPPGCAAGVPGQADLPELRFPVSATTSHRGFDTVTVIWEERPGFPPEPGQPCPPPPPGPPGGPGGTGGTGGTGGPGGSGGSGGSGTSTGGGWGDPHMITFDGLTYDSQTLGEYLYAGPLDDDPAAPRVYARHEFTSAASALLPTSITAVAVAVDDHVVEVYGREADELRIDGVPTVIASGESVELSDTATLRRSGTDYVVDHPLMTVQIQPGAHIDVEITVYDDGTFGGLIGIADGDPANDIIERDPDLPVESWTSYAVADARADGDLVIAIAESWRITEPDESPFSIPSDAFDDISPPRPGSELLEPYRVQAREMLAAVDAFCTGDTGAGAYAVDVFAIELAIGNDPALLGCTFEVNGRVVTDVPQLPVTRAEVQIDAPGLAPCVVTTASDGGFRCRLGLDSAEIAAGELTLPVDLTAVVTPRGAAAPAATVAVALDEPAPFNGYRAVDTGDIVVPVGTTKTLLLAGDLTALGEPVTQSTGVDVVARDDAGTAVLTRRLNVTPDGTGAYDTAVALPLDVTDVEVVWKYGMPGDPFPSASFDGLVPGTNSRRFDAAYEPVTVELSGTMLYNGQPDPAARIDVRSTRSDGSTRTLGYPVTADGAGAYSVDIVLPVAAAEVEFSGVFGSSVDPPVTATWTPPATGSASTTFDAIVDAPVLVVSGTVHRNGAVVRPTVFEIVASTGAGEFTDRRTTYPDPVDGSYSFDVDLPSSATAATVRALIGVAASDHPETTVESLVDGANPVAFVVDLGTPTLRLSGVATGGGVPWTSGFAVVVEADGFSTTSYASPAADGSYGLDVDLPLGTTDVDVVARIGYSADDWVATTFSGLGSGVNDRDLDPAVVATGIALSGALSLDGIPAASPVSLYLRGLDAGGDVVAYRTPVVTPTDGDYEGTTVFPPNVASVQAWAAVGWFPYQRPWQQFDDLVTGRNDLEMDDHAVTRSIAITGSITSGSGFVAGPLDLVVTSQIPLPDGGTDERVDRRRVTASYTDGTFAVDVLVPEVASSATIVAEVGPDPVDYPTLTIDPLSPGTNPAELTGDVPLSVEIELTAVLADADGPVTEPTSLRYITRDGSNIVIGDETIDIVPSSEGIAVVDIETLNVVRSIEVSRVVGLPGEPPPTTTFTGLRPGTNEVTFVDVYDPPVLTLSGTATRNGEPIVDDLELEFAVGDGALGATSFATTVTPGPDGTFSVERIFARGTTTTDVTITSPDSGDPVAQATVALSDGSQTASLDLVSARPQLELAGVALLGDAPPSGDVQFDLVLRGGEPDEQRSFDVDPDANGDYALDAGLLPHWVESATVTARIGFDPDDWPTQEIPALTPGPNLVTFDAIADVQLLDISGTIELGEAAYDQPFYLRIFTRDTDGLHIDSPQFLVEPDENGAYSYRYETPAEAAEVDLRASVFPIGGGSDAIVLQTFGPLDGGLNAIAFDPTFDLRAIRLSGTLLQDGAPQSAQQSFQIRTYTEGSSNIATTRVAATGPLDGSGGYVGDVVVLPADTTRVEVGINYPLPRNGGTWTSGNNAVYQTTDLAVPGYNEIDFSEDYVPNIVRMSGTFERDGNPITDEVTLSVTWRQYFPGSGVYPQTQTYTVTPDAQGDYSIDLYGARLANAVGVDVQIGVTAEDHPSVVLDPIAPGVDLLEFDVDYLTTTLELSGVLGYLGTPPSGTETLRIYTYDGFPGQQLGTVYATIDPDDVTGAYSTTVQIPSASVQATVQLEYGTFFETYERFVSSFSPLTPGTSHAFTFDAATTSIDLSGSVDESGVPFTNGSFALAIAAYDGAVELDPDVRDGMANLTTDGSGDYSTTVFLPAGTDRLVLTTSLGGVAPVEVTGFPSPGHVARTVDFSSSGIGSVTVSGTLTQDGAPIVGTQPSVTVTAITAEDDGDGPFYAGEEDSESITVSTDAGDGSFSELFDVGTTADFIQVAVIFPDAPDVPYIRNFDVRGLADPWSVSVDIDHSANRLEYSAFVEIYDEDEDRTDECAYGYEPFIFDLTVFAYDGEVGSPGVTATEVLSMPVIPAGDWYWDDSQIDAVVALPPGTLDVVFDIATWPYYFDDTVADANFGYAFAFGTVVDGGVTEIDDYVIADCDPIDVGF
ncbi:VWD domain-containing protein [Ilumatobacter fluminis]|uniref:VWD domain-containing protein n=1 Tax=Ilumatobacter fluminis TaxID=467091 RepID=UPI001AAEBD2C|nr:VWD domain-containing protein [Ilumatobacter fluminis]